MSADRFIIGPDYLHVQHPCARGGDVKSPCLGSRESGASKPITSRSLLNYITALIITRSMNRDIITYVVLRVASLCGWRLPAPRIAPLQNNQERRSDGRCVLSFEHGTTCEDQASSAGLVVLRLWLAGDERTDRAKAATSRPRPT